MLCLRSNRLVERYDLGPVSPGDLLRAEVRAQTPLGREAEATMAAGQIIDDRTVLRLVAIKFARLRARACMYVPAFRGWCKSQELT